MAHALRAIEQRHCTDGLRLRAEFAGGIDGAEGVGDVDEGEKLHLLVEQRLDGGGIERAVIKHRDVLQRGSRALREELPGHQIAVMLHAGDEDHVALTQVLDATGVRDEVDALRAATGEDDLVLGIRADETGRLFPRRLKRIRGAGAQLMQGTMDVGVVPFVIMRQRADDGPRLLAAGRAVEIDERVTIHLLVENRKIRADAMPVHDLGPRRQRAAML